MAPALNETAGRMAGSSSTTFSAGAFLPSTGLSAASAAAALSASRRAVSSTIARAAARFIARRHARLRSLRNESGAKNSTTCIAQPNATKNQNVDQAEVRTAVG